ncbi:MAG TPA: Hsp20/alpha crystallin family protein [Acidothermaceae bacterium]|jgi:HSP20 family protein
MLLERVDPYLAEFDRLTQKVFGPTQSAGLPMDVIRRGDELLVCLDVPGAAADKIGVTLENQVLTVTAERRANYGETDAVLAQERFEGTVSRRVRVPDWVNADHVTAEYVDGVLTIHLPLADKAKPRQIQVTTGANSHQIEA